MPAPDMTMTFVLALLITLVLAGLVGALLLVLRRRRERQRLMEILDQRIEVVTRSVKS